MSAANKSALGRRNTATALLLLILGATATSAQPQAPATPGDSERLQQLIDELTASASNRRLADLSLENTEAEAEEATILLRDLDGIDAQQLDHQEQLTLQILRWNARVAQQQPDLYWYSSSLMPAISPMRTALQLTAAHAFAELEDLDDYLDLLDECTASLQAILRMERGRSVRHIVLPDEQIDRVLPFWQLLAARGEAHPFYVAETRLADLPAADRSGFQQQVSKQIDAHIARIAQRIVELLDTNLRTRAPNSVGMGQYPGGKRAYRIATRLQTTLEVTPEAVHEIGLAGVADINRQMAAVREQLGFTGTKAEFHEQLRNDPRFYVDQPEQFGARLMEFDAKIRPHVFDFFLREPEAPYDVRRVNPALEASLTYGFYNGPSDSDPNGYYNYNGSKLSERSLLSAAALTYHELVPGHHFQIQLQNENEELPEFRRRGYYAGYGEGWGEYSSSVVAREMGMYEDPYALYGRLVFDMFFAVRLVVDTGMNYYAWSRPKAMLFMREHTMESDVQIDSETIRYSMRSPAQALAYRMGRDTFVRLRHKAEQALGERFDLRQFHEAVLSIGSVPLVVLEQHIDWWLAQQGVVAAR